MASPNQQELLRSLPQVDEALRHPLIAEATAIAPHGIIAEYARETIGGVRREILDGASSAPDLDAIAAALRARIESLHKPSLRPVINASGVIVHTNLGRSALADEAVEAVVHAAAGYSTLEYDCATMGRGSRHAHCERFICALTGAEAAIAVNNNAAAVMMVLAEFAAGHEAIVSRGELVEIGGSFRIPDIMKLSRAAMVEVGTTNKTHLSDYRSAITEDTAMLLKVHPSNYRMVGFTESVSIKDLRALADDQRASEGRDILVYEDQGSGALIELACFGEYAEPTVAESLRQGCDLISFSGDKLLGGPQAGIIVGAKHLIDRLKSNPMARALRLDKMTIAALEATLRLYLDRERASERIPTLRMLAAPAGQVKEAAEHLLALVRESVPETHAVPTLIPEIARAGGGALPMCDIESFAVCIDFLKGDAQSCEAYLITKRAIPIIARIKHDQLLLDARTILSKDEMEEAAAALGAYFASLDSASSDGIDATESRVRA